ncbi:MAG: HD domain-containing protein [Candidatus Asgardarchaeum sp.]
MAIIRGLLVPDVSTGRLQKVIMLNELDIEAFAANVFSEISLLWTRRWKDVENVIIKDAKGLSDFVKLCMAYFMYGESSKIQKDIAEEIFKELGLGDEINKSEINIEKNVYFFRMIPSDTRFGANTTSLLYHSKVVMAIVSALSFNKLSEEDFQILRIAALFHDIGKPFNWARHDEEGAKIFERFFGKIFDEKYKERIKQLISNHHKDIADDPLIKYLRMADVFESAQNRLSSLIEFIMNLDSYKEKHRDMVGQEFNINDYIKRYHVIYNLEATKELTDIFLTAIQDRNVLGQFFKNFIEHDPLRTYNEESADADFSFYMVKGDARGIKKFVDGSILIRELRGGSVLVSEAQKKAVLELINNNMPLEFVIYVGGGNIVFIAPVKDIEKYINVARQAFEETAKGVKITFAKMLIDIKKLDKVPFGAIWQILNQKLGLEKRRITMKESKIIPGGLRPCDSCRINLATKMYPRGEDAFYYCDNCYSKVCEGESSIKRLAEEFVKVDALGTFEEFSIISEHLMEFIAGADIETLKLLDEKEKEYELPNLMVMKADGNLMGEFFAWSISLHEIIEKSGLADLAIAKIIEKVYDFLSRIDRYMPLRFRLGQIYSDGDDILWLLPSEVAFQIAFIVVNEFYRRMGYLKRMSVALVSFHPKFPLPVAIKIADNLLSLTKSKTRKYEILTNDSDNICGWIDFEIIEGGGFTPESLKNIRENIGLLTRRPYPVKLKRSLLDLDDFANLFNYVTGINVDFCGRLSKDMREYMKSNVRVFRRVLEYLSLEMPYDDARRIAIAYCIRQIGRFKDNLERRKNYEIALTLLEPEKLGKDIPIKLLDGYVLLKILLGG